MRPFLRFEPSKSEKQGRRLLSVPNLFLDSRLVLGGHLFRAELHRQLVERWTASAETIKPRIVVALGGASTLKPRKMITSQETKMISIGFEIEGTACATSNDRSCPRSVATVVAWSLSLRC